MSWVDDLVQKMMGQKLREATNNVSNPEQMDRRINPNQYQNRFPGRTPTVRRPTMNPDNWHGPEGPSTRDRNRDRDMMDWFNSDTFRQMDANPLGPRLAAASMEAQTQTQATQGNPALDGLMAQLQGLLSKPDTPGQWISPYSQEYLDQIGAGMQQAGAQAQIGFGGLNDELRATAASLLGQRSDANSRGQTQLGGNLANLGLDFNNMDANKQWQADAAYLDQVANQNLVTQQGTNNVLGQLFAEQGASLGNAAREGLLTPKQWQGPQSGMTDGDRMMAGFLMDQIGRTQEQESARMQAELEAQMNEDLFRQIGENATEEFEQVNPLFPELLSGIQDPQIRSAVQGAYNIAGGDVPAAIKHLQEQLSAPTPTLNSVLPEGQTAMDLSRFGFNLNNLGQEGYGNQIMDFIKERINNLQPGLQQQTDGGGGYVPGGLTEQGWQSAQNALGQWNNTQTALQQLMSSLTARSQQDPIQQAALEYLMRISPTYTGVPTNRQTTNTSRFNFNALP